MIWPWLPSTIRIFVVWNISDRIDCVDHCRIRQDTHNSFRLNYEMSQPIIHEPGRCTAFLIENKSSLPILNPSIDNTGSDYKQICVKTVAPQVVYHRWSKPDSRDNYWYSYWLRRRNSVRFLLSDAGNNTIFCLGNRNRYRHFEYANHIKSIYFIYRLVCLQK